MTTYATFEDLTSTPIDDDAEDLALPSGKWVRLRGLTRYELMHNGKGTEDSYEVEARNVHSCLIEPDLTIDQVRTWQKMTKAGGDFKVMSEKIRDLSAVAEGADKSDLRAVRD